MSHKKNLFASDIGEHASPKDQPARATTGSQPVTQPPADQQPMSNPAMAEHVYEVAELNRLVSSTLAQQFSLVWLEGEVSSLSRPNSGHIYFTLKDANAQIRCALFRNTALRTHANALEIGTKVLVRAKVGLYEPRGEYQLIIQSVEEAGLGQLQRAFNALQAKLNKEGLFDQSRKRPLPDNIKHVGIITSRTGAAFRDIISTIRRRNPYLALHLYPSLVQGDTAPQALIAALNLAIKDNQADVLIIARGGGSMEDLWGFNDETLARALAACPIPTVSGVGHEVDVTICDWVCDVRAPTPTAAAEIVALDNRAQIKTLTRLQQRLSQQIQRQQARYASDYQRLHTRLHRQHPERVLHVQMQRLDKLEARFGYQSPQRAIARHQTHRTNLQSRLVKQLRHQISRSHYHYDTVHDRLWAKQPHSLITEQRNLLAQSERKLQQQIKTRLQDLRWQSNAALRQLAAVSPLQTIARGYAIVTDEHQHIVRSVRSVQHDQTLDIQLHDGKVSATVTDTIPRSPDKQSE